MKNILKFRFLSRFVMLFLFIFGLNTALSTPALAADGPSLRINFKVPLDDTGTTYDEDYKNIDIESCEQDSTFYGGVPTTLGGYNVSSWRISELDEYNTTVADTTSSTVLCEMALDLYNRLGLVEVDFVATEFSTGVPNGYKRVEFYNNSGGYVTYRDYDMSVYEGRLPTAASLGIATPNNKSFIGWRLAGDANCNIDFGVIDTSYIIVDILAACSSDTFTAHPEYADSVPVSFFPNGGSGSAPTSYTCTLNSCVLPQNTYTRAGYNFTDWLVEDGAINMPSDYYVKPGTDIVSWFIDVHTSIGVNLTAQWTENTYTVRFNSNNGTGTTKTQSFTYDTTQNLTANTFTNPGHTFLGWSRDKDATTATYTDRQSVKNLATSGEVTLYAVWQEHILNINYTSNGATSGSAPTSPVSCDGGSTCTLPANPYTKTGYTFAGWGCTGQTACDNNPTMTVGSSLWSVVPNDSFASGEDITLFPKWTENCNAITIKGSTRGGSGTYTIYKKAGSSKVYKTSACSDSAVWTSIPDELISTVKKDNAMFAGTTNDCIKVEETGQDVVNLSFNTATTCNVTGATTWDARFYCKSYWRGSGKNITGACTGSKVVFTYADDKNKTGTKITQTCEYGSGCSTYEIKDLYDGKVGYAAGTYLYDCADDSFAASNTCEGHNNNPIDGQIEEQTDLSWLAEDYIETYFSNAYSYDTVELNMTLYPYWVAVTNKLVVYESASATSAFSTNDCPYGATASVCIPESKRPTKAGYTLIGYCQGKNDSCSNVIGVDSANLSTLATGSTTINLTAQWQLNTYEITLDSGYYTSSTASGGLPVATVASPTKIYEKYGAGWYTNSAATTAFTQLTTLPKYNKAVFGGFYTGKAGTGTQVIDASGDVSSNKTIYSTPNATTGTAYAKYTACACVKGSNVSECSVSGTNDNNQCVYDVTCVAGYTNASNVGAVGVASNTMNCGTAAKYLLQFNGNGNDGGSVPTATSATYGLKLPSIDKTAIPTKTGYVFDGWYDTNASTGGNQYYTENNIGVSGKSFDKTSNTTLFARWTPDTYTINLNHNGGTSSVSSVSVTFNQQIPATVTKPSRVGYTFDGYYTSATGGTQYYDQNGNRKYTTTWAIAAGTTIYAHWTAIEYQCAASYYLPAGATKCELCKDGHYCTGGTYEFNETQDQGIGECPIGTYTVATSNVRFKCTACSKGLINSSPTDTGCEACPNTNNGVESWEQTDWDASTGVTNLCTIKACKDGYTGSGSGANTKCTANQYTVTLNVNGGTGGMASVTATYDSAMPKLTSVPTRDHYTLAGYYDTMATSGGNKYYNADGTSAKIWNKTTDMMLFARWIPDVYTITLDSFPTAAGILKVNPVEASPNKLYVKYEDGIYSEEKCINPVTKITPPTNDATAFMGFYTTATGTGNEIIAADGNFKIDLTRITSGGTLYARWSTRVTPCAAGKYLPKGANTCANCLAGYYCKGGEYAYNVTTNQGLTGVCAGGYSTGGATESACTACNTGYVATGTSAENHDAADDCKPITYHLKYSCGTGSGNAPAQVTAKYDTSYTVAANSCEKTGHTFLGWLCTGGGTSCNSTPVNAGVSVKNLTATNNATVTMTARWGLNAYKICFDSRGGSVTPECVDVEYGGALPTINLENMQMTGGTFLGFFDPNDLTKKYYNTTGFPAIEAYDIDSDITLVAKWNASTIKCNAGYYLPQNDATCKKCEAGYACPGGTFTYTGEMQGRTKCATDKYSEAGANICLICPRICDANYNCKDAVLVDVNKNGLNDSAHECYIQTNYTDASSTGTQYCYYTSGSTPSPVYDTNCAEKQIASCNAGYELQNGTCVLKNYTISYELNGGTNSDSNPNSYTVVSPTKVLQSPKRQGYTFVNWYTDSGSSVSQITNGTIGNIKLYAEWEPTSIKINYQCNGTTTKTQTCTIESTSCKLDPDVCEKSGFYYDYYVFDAVGSDIISSNFLKTDDLVTNGFVAELLAKPGNFWNQGAVINLVPDYKNLYTVPMQFNPACTKLTGQMPTNMTDCTNVSCVLPDANIECMGYREWNKVWLINNALTFNDMPFAVGTDIKDIVQEHNQELINVPVMVFPGWEPIEYTVIYQPNRPTQSTDVVVGEVSSTDHTYNTKKKVQQNTYSLRGYTSNGWNTEPDGSGTPIASGEEVENLTSIDGDNVTLYAQYTANTITIKLDDDLGDTSYTETSCTYGDKFTLPGTYRTGYTGYWTGSKNYFIPYQEYDCTYENLGVYEGEVTLTSAWTANTYTITFNANGGSGGQTTSKTATYDAVPPPITTTKPTKSGYAFMGYYDTSATTGGTQYYNANMDAVGVWNKTSDAVLYARWVSATSTLTINYTCIDGTTVSSKCVDGAPCYIGCADALSQCSVPVCIADGYNITGYKLTDDSTGNVLGEYKHNHNASGMPKYHTGQSWTMTAIPQMVANEYSITYKDGDNTISGLIPTSYTVETTTFSLPTPIKTGYTFVSWHTDKELTSPAIAQIKKGTIGNNTYYAKWEANRTTITLNKNANDATDGTSRVIAIYGDVMPTPITLPTRHGYTFAGYYDTSATSGGTQYYTATGASAHNWNQNTGGTGLYARWIPNTYKITLDNQGATTAGTSEFYFQYGTDKYYVDRELTQEIIKITLPTKTGYTFNCYAHTPAGGSTEIAVDGTIDTPYVMQLPQDSTIYAQWKANTYTVTFNSNNGKSQTKTQSFTYDVAQNLQQNTFSHPGYTFLGWSMNKDATTVQYTDVQSVKNLTTEINGNVTLYAVWEANKLNITYSANGGKGTAPSKPIVCPIDSVCEIPANTYSKTGYDFAGWGCSGQNSCDVDPTMPVDANLWNYVKFDSVTDGEYITLYPKWTAKKITCNVGEYLDILTCRSCEAGYKCPSTSVTYTYNTEVQGLVACSAATEYQNQPGQTMCKIVDDGYYKTSDTTQVQCGNNYYCKNSVRTQCADGGITATATASLATQCYKTGQSCTTVGGFGTNTCNYNLTTKDYTDCAQCIVDGCDDGYYLDNGTCVICPVGSYCANSVKTSCPINYTTKQTGAVTDVECFTTCSDKEVVYGTAFADKPEVFWSAACTYTYGISVTGNPCKIINNVCVETSCNYDYEMINGKCELCVRDNALTFKSGAGNCIVESCLYGYHPFDQSCVPNTRECSIDGALSAEQKWDTKTNNFGPCMVTECAEGYHIDANTCVLDVQTCKLENGMGEKVYNHDLKKWGDCVVTTCKPGYTNDPSQTNETWKQCGQCNNMFGANGERAVSSYLTECEIASCMYQGEKYILENNECVLICDERSDETGFRYWDGKKCVHECSPGFLTW